MKILITILLLFIAPILYAQGSTITVGNDSLNWQADNVPYPYFSFTKTGIMSWGLGTKPLDTRLKRTGTSSTQFDGNLTITQQVAATRFRSLTTGATIDSFRVITTPTDTSLALYLKVNGKTRRFDAVLHK